MLSHFSRVWLFVISWTVAHQAPLSMGFSRQEHWSRLPFPSPGIFPGIEPASFTSPELAGGFFTTGGTWEAHIEVSVQFSSVAQSCLTLCNPMDCGTLGFPVYHRRVQGWTHFHPLFSQEWVSNISIGRAKSLVSNSVTPGTIAQQSPLSMEFSRQEYLRMGCYALSRGPSRTQDWTLVSLRLLHCRQILYHWATREALM